MVCGGTGTALILVGSLLLLPGLMALPFVGGHATWRMDVAAFGLMLVGFTTWASGWVLMLR